MQNIVIPANGNWQYVTIGEQTISYEKILAFVISNNPAMRTTYWHAPVIFGRVCAFWAHNHAILSPDGTLHATLPTKDNNGELKTNGGSRQPILMLTQRNGIDRWKEEVLELNKRFDDELSGYYIELEPYFRLPGSQV